MKNNREQHPVGISSQATFIRDSSLFSISLVLVGFCGLIRSFFIAKFLGPQAFGTWRFVNIFAEYLHCASLGTGPAMHRRIPFLRGRGDVKQLQVVLNTAWATNFYTAILYSIAVFAWSFFVTDSSTSKALATFSPVIFLSAWKMYAFTFFMDTELYRLRSRLEIMHAISTMLFSLVLISYWGVYGAIAGLGISALTIVVISARHVWQHYAFKIDRRTLWGLMVTGLPITADIMLPIMMGNIDRILIAALLSRELLGIYSVGNAGVSILGMIPSAFGQILFVKFAEMDGQNKTKEHISDVLDRTTLILSGLFAPILSIAIACFPIAVVFLLPQYVKGIAAGKLLIAGLFFLGISMPVTKWCVSTGRSMPVLALRLIVLIAEFIAIFFVISNGARLELIALCILFAFAIFSTAMIVICNRLLERSYSTAVTCAAKTMLPFLSILSVLWIQDVIYPIGTYALGDRLFVSCILGLVVSLVMSIPFIYWANKRTRFAELIFRTI